MSIPNDIHLQRLLDRLHDASDAQTEAIREQGAERDWPTPAPEERAALIKSFLSRLVADMSGLDRIHSGSRHKLYRARISDASIVLKASSTEPPSEGAMALLRHEYELLGELKLPGIISVIGAASVGNGLALLMEDAGDTNLAALIFSRRLSIADFLNIAVQLADAVARLHDVRIVHRDIHPGNIVWNSESEVATLCDFAIARTLPTLAMEGPNHKQLEGTLPYMSPEQTGRTGRSTDWRTDLYSLGATFYEMLTGAPPFAEGDPVALAHAHIARQARPPHEINPEVPLALSRIVLKLLEKEPEQRYQSANALADDLGEARKQWLRSTTIEPFPLAAHEVPRGLSIPDKLYGRDEELQSLADAFARTSAGGREFVLVTGGPGIGKSALVESLRPSVAACHGYYAAGKFDQLQRSVPFSGLAQALRSLVRQLLTESEAALERWREQIEDAVAPNGQLLVAIVPELESILGPQPSVLEVGPVEARNRFYVMLTRFLRVFAQPEHPLVLFLDDLQWVDAASLQLFEQWVGDAARHHLLLVAAYRDNEVGPSHPLALSLSGLRDTGADIYTIHLKPLGSSAVAQLAADTFGEEAARMQFLANLIIRKSAGNPFFVRRLLRLMHAQRFFRFLSDSHRWTWDEAEIERAPITDNVLDLMVQAIDRLPPATQRLLQMGACIGHHFDLGILAELADLSGTAVTEQVWPAIEDGLLIPIRDTDRPSHHSVSLDERSGPFQEVLQFAHDRVQQAAYALLSEQSRQALHHAIGRRLLAQAGDDLDETLFEIVDQIDLGEAHVVDAAEHSLLVDLNLAAGRKAKASAAYRAAFEYLTVARRHLGEQAWDNRRDVTFAVHLELAESAYLAGEHATAEELVETSLDHASSKVAKAELYGLRVLAATVVSDWPRALRWGREGLSVFGQEWPLESLGEAIEAEATAVMQNLGKRKISDLVNEPDVEDADIRASMRLISILGAPAYFSGADVLTFLVTRAANLSLMHGPSPYSAFAYVFYGGIHNIRTGQYDIGYEFGKLALAMARRFGNRAEECRTVEVYGVLVHHWKAPLRDGLPLLKEGFRAGVESGETAFAAFSLNSVLINALPSGIPLDELLAEAEVALDFAITQKNRTSIEIALPQRQVARALTGATSRPDVFDDQEFSETRFLEEAGKHETALGHYWVAKLQLAYHVGDYDNALKYSGEAAKRIPTGILGMITSAEHVFYTALTIAAAANSCASKSTLPLGELSALHGKLANWAEYCPQNFAHKMSLVGAEIARLERKPGEALILYRAAIDEAERQQFIQDEALGHELRARFLLSVNEPALAEVHFRFARDRYRRWGATVKVSALEREYPHCLAPELSAAPQGVSIDAMALIKASQAISAETVPEKLFEQILRVVVEVAGAQKGALVLSIDGLLTVRARIEAAEEYSVSLAERPLAQYPDLPSAILRYVIRTKEVLLLSDAGTTGVFTGDPVVQQRELRSVLCVPLTKQATVVGLLYLENNALAGAFATELTEVLQVLAAQAVISLENSRLLGELQELTGALEERVIERTRQLTDEITARDKAQAALRESEQRHRALVTASSHVVYRMSADWTQMLRLEGQGFIADTEGPRGDWLSEYIHPDDQPALMETIQRAIATKTMFELEHPVRRVDGTLGWTHSRAVPLLDQNGDIIEWFGAASDVTDRKRAELDLRELNETLGQRVETEVAQRMQAEENLRQAQKMEAIGHLTGGIAHDFNNLLQVVLGNLDGLRRRLYRPALPVRDDIVLSVERAMRGADRAAILTQHLLAFSRRQPLDPRPVDVNRLVLGISEMLHRTLGESVNIETVLGAGLWRVFADPSQLENSILNLAVNARDAMPDGGKLTIETANAHLDEAYAGGQQEVQPGQYVMLALSDTGCGMTKDVIASAFDPFFTTKDVGQGTGLGLSQVYGFVKQSHGHVKIYSEPGEGTTIRIYLPRLIKDAAVAEDAASDVVPSGDASEVVLVVEDDEAVRELTVSMLRELNYSVIEGGDGPQALQILESVPGIRILFTDVGLPGEMNGRQLAEAAFCIRPKLRVLFTTGYARNAIVHQGRLDPGIDLISKPFTAAALAVKVRELLDRA